MTQLTIL